MAEPHPGAELGQAGFGRGRGRLGADPEPAGRPPHQRRVTGRVGRRQQQQPPGRGREGSHPPPKLSSMLPARGTAPGSPNPPASSAAVNPRGSSARPAGCRASRPRSDPAPARRSARAAPNPAAPGHRFLQPAEHQLRQTRQITARNPGREHQPTDSAPRRRATTPGPAPRRDQATARRPRGISAASPRRPRTAGSARPGRPGTGPAPARAHAERDPQRVLLRRRQILQPVQHRRE